MEWGNCINGGNNKYYSYPANMYDGRNFAEWRPGAVVNTTIRNNNHETGVEVVIFKKCMSYQKRT